MALALQVAQWVDMPTKKAEHVKLSVLCQRWGKMKQENAKTAVTLLISIWTSLTEFAKGVMKPALPATVPLQLTV